MVAQLPRPDAQRSSSAGGCGQPDLAAAVAANDAAVARANAALSAAYPQVDAAPHFLANKQSANRPLRSANQPTYYGDNLIGAQTAYEIDIWGRVRDIVASANAKAEASADALADARLELHAELARDYVNLRGFDDQAKLLSDTIAIYRSALKLTQDRLAANIVSPVDVDRAQAQLSSAEAQASDLGSIAPPSKIPSLRWSARPQPRFRFSALRAGCCCRGRQGRCPRTCCAAGRTSRKPNG